MKKYIIVFLAFFVFNLLNAQSPEIKISGNNVEIVDGDNTPSTTDYTDFGNVEVLKTRESRIFTISNTGSGALTFSNNPIVSISGTNASDFKVQTQASSTLAASSSVNFTIIFDPSTFGVRTATITVESNDADEATYNFDIKGSGATPSGGTINTLTVNSGGYMDIGSGSYINVSHLHFLGTANITNDGTILVKSDWTNESTTTVSGDGTYSVKGSSAQNVSPNGATIKKMIIDNSTDVSLESDGTIEDLTLTSGDLDIGDNDLTLTGTISGGSSNSYIKVSGTGKVKRSIGSTPVTLPIGRNPYLPIVIDDGGGAEFSVGVYNNVYDNPVTENTLQTEDAVSETWTIQADQAVDNVIVQIGWDSGEELSNFDRTKSTVAYWQSGVSSTWTNSGTFNGASGSGPYFQSITLDFSTNLYYFGVASAGSPLPIELGSFNANWVAEGKEAQIEWNTLSELNNSHFILEKSYDGISFIQFKRIEGAGNSIEEQYYSVNDFDFEKGQGQVYYRLKQVDYDGSYSFSDTRTLLVSDGSLNQYIKMYPNPASDKLIVKTPDSELDYSYAIHTLDGKLVASGENNNKEFIELTHLNNGQYVIEILSGNHISRQLIHVLH
ncbi:MAG: choice-of-anchor D domain-containing protein [Bacteroidia bacterium]